MITPLLIEFFEKDLDKLKQEINQYPDDASLWSVSEGIANSGGNLCLHLCGSLQHFLGAVLNSSGYVRNRDAEFSLKNITRRRLLDEVEAAKLTVRDTLEQLSKNELQKNYPVQVGGNSVSTEYFLFHLLTHNNYHLGQINYHRRLLTGNIEVVPIPVVVEEKIDAPPAKVRKERKSVS